MADLQCVSLDEIVIHFQALEDPRSTVNRRHPLASVVVIALRQDVTQGLAVALDLQERLLVRADRLLAIKGGGRVVFIDSIALDAVRALNGTGQRGTAQDSLPPPRCTKDVAQLLAHLVDLTQHSLVFSRQGWGRVDHRMTRCCVHIVMVATE